MNLGHRIRFLLGVQAALFILLMFALVWFDPSPRRSWALIVMCVGFGACHGLLWRASVSRDRLLDRDMRSEMYEGTKQAIEEAVRDGKVEAS